MTGWWGRLFGGKERARFAPLYQAIVAIARRPRWYRDGGVPDTLDGRFDMVATIVGMVLLRLEAAGEAGRAPAAHLTELFVDDMDGQLRQSGIGDIVVGKHIGKMMAALGGRLGALREAFEGGDLDAAIMRNIYRGSMPADAAQPAVVRGELLKLRAALVKAQLDALLQGKVDH